MNDTYKQKIVMHYLSNALKACVLTNIQKIAIGLFDMLPDVFSSTNKLNVRRHMISPSLSVCCFFPMGLLDSDSCRALNSKNLSLEIFF